MAAKEVGYEERPSFDNKADAAAVKYSDPSTTSTHGNLDFIRGTHRQHAKDISAGDLFFGDYRELEYNSPAPIAMSYCSSLLQAC